MTFAPYDRPVRAAFIGLGRIYDLNVRGYLDNPDVEVVALVDPLDDRRAQRQADWPDAKTFGSAAELAASGVEVDAVECLLPVQLHADGVPELLGYGWHVNLQKPMCNTLPDAQRMLDAAAANDRVLRRQVRHQDVLTNRRPRARARDVGTPSLRINDPRAVARDDGLAAEHVPLYAGR